jgi:23S rRNA (uracil1939-C5)-methyltransferase
MLQLTPHDMAHGGEAVARVDGKTWFVGGAMPGERILGDISVDKGAWGRVELRSVEEPSPHRVDPPCAHFGTCGGCHWQFADHTTQLDWKRSIVAGQLRHLGRIADPDVRATVAPSGPYGYRNRMDFSVDGGRPALFRGRSNTLVPIEHCWLLEPALADLFARLGPLDGVSRLTLRVGAATGDALVVLTGAVPSQAEDWGASVVRRHRDGYEAILGDPWINEKVAGLRFRVSADAFFQNSTPAAAALTMLVREALQPGDDDVVLDGYAGGGLFSAALAGSVARIVAVESNPMAADDLRHNTATFGNVSVVRSRMDRLRPGNPWTAAVVDPPRAGLGPDGVRAVTAPLPRTLVYVSCDPASLARDAKSLIGHGYELDHATPVDQFPQTFHVETVARFTLRPG